MKLYSQALEIEALKAICCGDAKVSGAVLGRLDDSFFFTEIGKEAFARIKFIAKERTKILTWSELLTDPCLSEELRESLRSVDSDFKGDADGVVNNLDSFRKSRILFDMSENISTALTQDKLDVDEVLTSISQMFVKAKTGKNIEDCFTKIGQGSNVSEDLKEILTGTRIRYYKTGYKQWDDRNAGIPIGKLGVIAATTGGGKSLCINQLAINMALNGIKVCIVPLEMSKEDMLHRFLANKTDLDMGKITKATELTKEERRQAYSAFRAFEKQLAGLKTSIELFHPDSDMTMEDVLFTLKPFHFDIIMIDYIGLLGGLDGDNQWKKMMDAARFAKRWAETNDATVLIAAQLNQEQVIRYSKGICEHADLMWGWNAGKLCDATSGQKIIKIESQKGRNQEQLAFYLKVDYRKMSMVDATQKEIEDYEAQTKHASKNQNTNMNQTGKSSYGGSKTQTPGTIDADYADI